MNLVYDVAGAPPGGPKDLRTYTRPVTELLGLGITWVGWEGMMIAEKIFLSGCVVPEGTVLPEWIYEDTREGDCAK